MNRRTWITPLAALAIVAMAAPVRAELVLPRVSPNATLSQTNGTTDLTHTYSRPGVKGRTIWGGLVPYGQPWRTGANDATRFTTTDEITVAGKKLPAGTYSFFTIPTATEWTVVFNKEKDLWGAYEYKPEHDALRVTVKPTAAPENTEWMSFSFDNLTPQSADLVLQWEKLRISVPIAMDVNGKVLANARTEIAAAKKDDWRTPYRAAGWAFDAGVAKDEAAGWLDQSLKIEKAHANLALKARWLAKDGKKAEAIATAKQAVAAGKASKDKVDTSATEKLITDWMAAN
jgi:hypothetical protein